MCVCCQIDKVGVVSSRRLHRGLVSQSPVSMSDVSSAKQSKADQSRAEQSSSSAVRAVPVV